MKNQHINVTQLAEEPNFKDYQQKPVQNYGLSLLKGMGFDQSKGIGKRKNNQLSEILILKRRPKGLGLGAEPNDQAVNQQFKIGDSVLITENPHQGLFGVIHQVKDDMNFLIQLGLSKSIVKINKKTLKKITGSEKAKLEGSPEGQVKQEGKKKKLRWVCPQIRVKVIDPKSTHYLKKVVVTDLLSNRQFECRDESGRALTQLGEADVQTVIPKSGIVLVVRGPHRGSKAQVVERKKGKVIVQTEQELDMLQLCEDDVCQFVEL